MMTRITRRHFFGSAAAVASAGFVESNAMAATRDATGPADLIISGANLLTMDPGTPSATAIAIRGQHIAAVGSDDDVLDLKGPNTELLDGRGHTVTPGFIDAHSHPLLANEAISANVNLRRISDVQQALASQASRTPPGTWVLGSMYDDTKFEDGRPLTRWDIDDSVPNRPVFVSHRGGGFLMLGGRESFTGGKYERTPIGELLPIYLDRVSDVADMFPERARGDGRFYVRDFDLPELRNEGRDPSIEKAVEVLLAELGRGTYQHPETPIPPDLSE